MIGWGRESEGAGDFRRGVWSRMFGLRGGLDFGVDTPKGMYAAAAHWVWLDARVLGDLDQARLDGEEIRGGSAS